MLGMNAIRTAYTVTMPAPVIIVTFVVAWRGGQQSWLYADFFGTMFVGISLLLTPRFLLEYQTEVRLDNVSIHLARVVGALFLSSSMDVHRALSSSSRRELGSIARSRTLTAILVLLASTYAHQHYTEWNFRFRPLTIIGTISWLLPHLRYALVTNSAARPEPQAVSFFLLFDSFLTAAAGIAWYAYPQWLLRMWIQIRPNGVSVTMGRIMGALLVGLAAESCSATQFTELRAKKFTHWARIVTCCWLEVLLLYSETLEQAFNTTHIIAGTCAILLWAGNAILGYLTCAYLEVAQEEEQKYRDGVGEHTGRRNVTWSRSKLRTHGVKPLPWKSR